MRPEAALCYETLGQDRRKIHRLRRGLEPPVGVLHLDFSGFCRLEEFSGGFELLKMVTKKEKRLKPLDERYREIADILRRPKYEELLTQYKQSLWDASSIVYF